MLFDKFVEYQAKEKDHQKTGQYKVKIHEFLPISNNNNDIGLEERDLGWFVLKFYCSCGGPLAPKSFASTSVDPQIEI